MANQLARDEAGNIWEVDAQGNPVRLHSQGNSPNVLVPAPPKEAPKPEFVPGHPNIVYHPDTGQTTSVPGIPAEGPKPTFIPGKDGYIIGPDGTAHPIAGLPGPGVQLDASQRAKAIDAFAFSKQLQQTVDELRTLYNAGPGATKGVSGFKDYLPYATNKNFDAKANAARGIVGQVMGFTGGQLNTQQEAEKAVGPYLPQSSDYDATILQKIDQLQSLANQGREKAIQTLGGEPDANGIIHPVNPQQPKATTQQVTTAQDDPLHLNGGGKTRAQIDPTLKALGKRVGAMLVSGVPDSKIIDLLQRSGVNPAETNIGAALQTRGRKEFKQWMSAHPGQAYPIGPDFYTKQVPVSPARRMFNATAATDLGGDAAAGIVATGNSMMGNRGAQFIGALGGDPQMAETGMELLRTNHSAASFAGDLAGQALAEASIGRIPGAQALMATRWGRRGADALYGAYSGSGGTDDPGVGGLEGAGLNLLGGAFGRVAQRGAGRAMTGIQNANLGYLNKLNIPMSLGRIARGSDNEFGKAIGGLEDRLAGVPGMDAVVGDVRQQGDQAFSREAMRQIDPSITKNGHEGLAQAYAAEDAAYQKLHPAQIAVDQPFDTALTNLEATAQGLRHHSGDVQDVVKDIRDQIANGGMNGKGYQTAMQAIRKTRASLTDDVGGKAADILDALENEVAGLGARQGGQVGQDLAAANALHGRIKIMEDALRKPVSQKAGEVVSPTTLNQSSINNVMRFGGPRVALSDQRPFYGLTKAGMDVMPNATPDSGTAGRMAVLSTLMKGGGALGGVIGAGVGSDDRLTGGAEGTGYGLLGGGALAGLLMAPYSKGGQKLIQKALLAERPQAMQQIGKFLVNRSPKYTGMFGSSILRDYFLQPELPQQ